MSEVETTAVEGQAPEPAPRRRGRPPKARADAPKQVADGKRYFVTAIHPNTKFQVKHGRQVGANPLVREGDKFVRFKDGIYATSDPDEIAFCEMHPEIYDLLGDPDAARKMDIDYASLNLSNREPMLVKRNNPAADTIKRALAQVAAAVS